MSWTFTADPDGYVDAVLPLLASDPVRNTVALTVLDALRHGQRWSDAPMTLGWFTEPDGTVSGAVSMTPPFGLLLTAVPAAALPLLVEQLRRRGTAVPSVNGIESVARGFASLWGGPAEQIIGNRLFQLDTLSPPSPPPVGSARLVEDADLDWLMDWIVAFHAESEPSAPATPREMMAYRVGRQLFWFWLTEQGDPVSMAGRNVTVAGVSRVGPVYTPPAQRGRGYAAAVTAVCTQHALDTDAERAILFTDIANPTSNGIYQRLGYRPLEDRVVLRLG